MQGEGMNINLNHIIDQVVKDKGIDREILVEADVVAEGLRMLQARESLREEVAKGFAQFDAGRGVPADEVYARAAGRISQIERGER